MPASYHNTVRTVITARRTAVYRLLHVLLHREDLSLTIVATAQRTVTTSKHPQSTEYHQNTKNYSLSIVTITRRTVTTTWTPTEYHHKTGNRNLPIGKTTRRTAVCKLNIKTVTLARTSTCIITTVSRLSPQHGELDHITDDRSQQSIITTQKTTLC